MNLTITRPNLLASSIAICPHPGVRCARPLAPPAYLVMSDEPNYCRWHTTCSWPVGITLRPWTTSLTPHAAPIEPRAGVEESRVEEIRCFAPRLGDEAAEAQHPAINAERDEFLSEVSHGLRMVGAIRGPLKPDRSSP